MSPFIATESVAFFLLLRDVRVHSLSRQRVIQFSSKMSFGVYLIDASLFYKYPLRGSLEFLASRSAPTLVFDVFLITITMYIAFSILEFVRSELFRILKIHLFTKWIVEVVGNGLDRTFHCG